MQSDSESRIVDITKGGEYEKYLHRCLVGPPARRYRKRIEYLNRAIPRGFHKKLLIVDGDVVGTIEYAPSEVSYYPIIGDNVMVVNCIWVLRRAKGHNFGKLLVEDMRKSEKHSSCFATIALKDHWSPWFRKWQMEKLGFKPLESIRVTHNTKYKGRIFSIYLVWMPATENVESPAWNRRKLLEGITMCIAHPLYHPQTYKPKQILAEVNGNCNIHGS